MRDKCSDLYFLQNQPLLPPPTPTHRPCTPIHQLHAAIGNGVDMLSVDGVAAVDAGEGVRRQKGEHVAHRAGVEQRAAIAEVKAGVVALAAQGQDMVDGDKALAVWEG